jgi:predicted HTH domain antitoxin
MLRAKGLQSRRPRQTSRKRSGSSLAGKSAASSNRRDRVGIATLHDAGRPRSGTLSQDREEKPMAVLTIELPEEIFASLRRSPRELELEVRLAAAIDWYQRGLISQGKGAEIAGIPRADFIDALGARKIEVVQVDFDSLERDLERALSRHQRRVSFAARTYRCRNVPIRTNSWRIAATNGGMTSGADASGGCCAATLPSWRPPARGGRRGGGSRLRRSVPSLRIAG